MTEHELARQLRRRQYNLGGVDRELIDALSDDAIIDCYITCNHCSKKQVEGRRLKATVARATSADHFLRLCNEASPDWHAHPHHGDGR